MKKSYPISFLMLALASLAFVVGARAQDSAAEKAPSKAMLQKYDTDHDGKLSPDEKAAAKADAKARHEAKKAADLAKYDANHDGKLDKEEKAKMKADKEAEREARKKAREAKKAGSAAKTDDGEAK